LHLSKWVSVLLRWYLLELGRREATELLLGRETTLHLLLELVLLLLATKAGEVLVVVPESGSASGEHVLVV